MILFMTTSDGDRLGTIRPQLETVTKIITRNLGSSVEIYLFGSWANQTSYNESDIDIAVDTGKPIPTLSMYKIKEEIDDLPTLRSFDIVDLNSIAADFRENILSNSVKIDPNGKE
ncbi:MAG: nucleotidyltransferase domain-containing protein [Planctomycetes bacterium]|nr:nucleotidyltransferase domain-containing protein [Planctomycetota bacterium]